ncbi:hypothetical protein DPMN_140209 [Dreissena polymorpha]|uniref:TNF family profile domain-containing protein n=2 Tax=Dreissena polymorpha TaxID=45954 RepID=A0A9D4G765_DREPO|nr:hypothetical protein DPMN_140209 [Dreissena polymorpha]
MRVASPTYTEAEDEEIYHARPILQLESMGLGGDNNNRTITWSHNHGLIRSGLALKDNHKIEFKTTGFYFISTELAYKPYSTGILQVGFTVFGNQNKDNSKDISLRSKSETLRNQLNDSRYVSECNFVDFFTTGSHLYVKLHNVEGLQKEESTNTDLSRSHAASILNFQTRRWRN